LSTTSNETAYWVAFNRIPGIGRVKYSRLLNHFGSLGQAWKGSAFDFAQAGLDEKTVSQIVEGRPGIDPGREMEQLRKAGVQVITCRDAGYPARLKEIHDYPPLLYVKGELAVGDEIGIAVVGSRRATAYGKQVTTELAGDLCRHELTIISGLAQGIDSAAHQAALDAGGRTVAVCATGLDRVYPATNYQLARRITGQGALISEYPLGTRPRPEYFLRRNRIMAGMCLGVLVTEARQESGALITTKLALEYDREVFAVPGSIFSENSRGTNLLIREGAKAVMSTADVLGELNLPVQASQKEVDRIVPETRSEATIVEALRPEPRHVDALARSTGLPVSTVSSVLAIMELKGWVRQTGPMVYHLVTSRVPEQN
jgi:DNA processing protein